MRINKARNIKSGIKIWVESSHTLTPAGTIGTHSLTVAELPAHSHSRGTQDITGSIQNIASDTGNDISSGALYWGYKTGKSRANVGSTTNNPYQVTLKASNKWTGTSESIGSGTAHGHSWTGTEVIINHMNPYSVAYCFKRIS